MSWTAERTTLLTQRWAEGASVRAIMRELGLDSAGAVAGKVRRLKLARRIEPKGFRREPSVTLPVASRSSPSMFAAKAKDFLAWRQAR